MSHVDATTSAGATVRIPLKLGSVPEVSTRIEYFPGLRVCRQDRWRRSAGGLRTVRGHHLDTHQSIHQGRNSSRRAAQVARFRRRKALSVQFLIPTTRSMNSFESNIIRFTSPAPSNPVVSSDTRAAGGGGLVCSSQLSACPSLVQGRSSV